jgi:DNA-binding transcriptional LysR family regulator
VTCNLARFDLVSVRLAVLCAELGSLTAAAKKLPCSISCASGRVIALEEALGATLFVRGRHGVQLTPAGVCFLEHGKAILQRVELTHQHVRERALEARAAVPIAPPSTELTSSELHE